MKKLTAAVFAAILVCAMSFQASFADDNPKNIEIGDRYLVRVDSTGGLYETTIIGITENKKYVKVQYDYANDSKSSSWENTHVFQKTIIERLKQVKDSACGPTWVELVK